MQVTLVIVQGSKKLSEGFFQDWNGDLGRFCRRLLGCAKDVASRSSAPITGSLSLRMCRHDGTVCSKLHNAKP